MQKQEGMLPSKVKRFGLGLLGGAGAIVVLSLLFPNWLQLRFDMLWNLFLEALPLGFSLLLYRRTMQGRGGVVNGILWAAWLLFFPNAPYMLTDLAHLTRYDFFGADGALASTWLGLAHLAGCAALGCLFGFLSLWLAHTLVARQAGQTRGWLFCAAVCLVSGLGIYIGRFLRFNSWDLFTRPAALLRQMLSQAGRQAVGVILLFATVVLGGYLLFALCFGLPPAGTREKPLSKKGKAE